MLTLYKLPALKKLCNSVLLMLLCVAGNVSAQKTKYFSHSTPEAEGVSASGIDSFINAFSGSVHEMHSFMLLRHGKVIAEGWWNPYEPTLRHSMYSTSKSFTSTAVGFAIAEKKLKVSDKVISFFPEYLPATVSPYLAQLTVKDLLTMSVGQQPDPTTVIPFGNMNWVKAFLATPIVNQPGSKFLYNSVSTFMLSAIVQKVTGQKEFDYLKPRLFEPLQIKGIDWEVNNDGINTGGWGLRLKTEDMAKFGQLYLQKGMWKGKQVLPKDWVDEATTFKIDQAPGVVQSKKDSSDWMQGYCYQFWRCRHNAFRADGAFGQYVIVMPDQDAVLTITSETPDMQGELNLVWKYLLPAMHPQAIPENKVADATLDKHLNLLGIAPIEYFDNSLNVISNKIYKLEPNPLKIKSLTFNVSGEACRLVITKDSASYTFNFQSGAWFPGTTEMQGPSLLYGAKENFKLLSPYKIESCFAWLDKQTLQLKIRYIESPHTETFTCHLNDDELKATIANSFNYGKNNIELTGKATSGH